MGELLVVLSGYVVAGFAPGLAVYHVEGDEAGGYVVESLRHLDPDSTYFFPDPSKADWDAYVFGGPPVSWATCYGLTGGAPLSKAETPGYVALGASSGRLAVIFVYGTYRESWGVAWDGSFDYVMRQGAP